MTSGISAAAVLDRLGSRPRLLGLGEPTHGCGGVLAARNDLVRELVTGHGYRTVALESDCLRGQLVDDHVTTGAGTLDDVLRDGLSHEWGAFAGNRDLVRWMRAYNQERPAAEQVRFAGFDGPLEMAGAAAPRPVLTALHTTVAALAGPGLLPCTAGTLDELLGDDERWTDPAAMHDPARSVGRTPAARQLRLLADDLATLVEAHTPALAAPDRDRARLLARTATGLLRYHYWTADPSPERLTWLVGLRDTMMAANLLALAGHGPVLVSAHNGHLQRDRSSMRMGGRTLHWWSAGAQAAAALGADYAVVATAVGTIRGRGVDVPPAGTIEGRLYARAQDRLVADPRTLTGTARVSPWFGYAPLDPAHLGGIDAVVFVRDAD